MFVLFAWQVSAACEPVTPSFDLLTPPRAEQGVWFAVGWLPTLDDFTVSIDGTPVEGELLTWTDPGGFGDQRNFALFLPTAPFEEGQAYQITLPAGYPEFTGTELLQGTVEAGAPTSSSRIDLVTVGASIEGSGADCLPSGETFREVSVELSAGSGLVELTDDTTGEVVKIDYVDGEAATLVFYRPGASTDLACISADVTRADGGTLSVAAVCSDQGNVCDCSSAPGAGLGWLAAALLYVGARVRRR
jgi:MYXO-CTERM domain-containing protein